MLHAAMQIICIKTAIKHEQIQTTCRMILIQFDPTILGRFTPLFVTKFGNMVAQLHQLFNLTVVFDVNTVLRLYYQILFDHARSRAICNIPVAALSCSKRFMSKSTNKKHSIYILLFTKFIAMFSVLRSKYAESKLAL